MTTPDRSWLTRRALLRGVTGAGLLLLSGCAGRAPTSSSTPAAAPATADPGARAGAADTAAVSKAPGRASGADAPPMTDLVRLAWQDVGAPTPFRISAAGPGGAALLTFLFDTLTWKDAGGIIPWLADSWTISPDGRDYRFVLAEGPRWQDGQPLTAEDVAFSFGYYQRHPYRWMSTAVVERADAGSDRSVTIRLRHPYAPFLEDIAGVVPIIPRHVWSAVADPVAYAEPGASLGSGPYRLAEYRPAEGAYRFVANPSYFRGRPRVAEIQQLNLPPETRMQAAQQGQVELVQGLDLAAVALFEHHPRVRAHLTPPQSVVRLVVNTGRPPLDQVDVRRALLLALDRARIAETLTGGEPLVGVDGVVPPGSPWHNPRLVGHPFDPARARAALGGRAIAVELLADPTAREPDLMVPMLAEAGVTLTVRRADQKTRSELQREGRFDLALTGHIGIGGDPDFLRRWFAGEEANDFALGVPFREPEFDRQAGEQAATPEFDRRLPLVHRLQELVAELLPTIVLYHRRFVWAYDSTKFRPLDTWGGLLNGVPFPHNKLAFLGR